jgi:BMFP domain-containing protein YqiC
MTQTSNRIFDEMARLMNDAAGVATGVRREVDTLFKSQAERILRDLDVVQREEFEAVKEMAKIAREENEALKARIAALEAQARGGAARPDEIPSAPPSGAGSSVPPEKAAPNVMPNTPFEE